MAHIQFTKNNMEQDQKYDTELSQLHLELHKDATIYRMLVEKVRSGAFFPGSEASVLTLQGKCLLFKAKAAHFSGHLLAARRATCVCTRKW